MKKFEQLKLEKSDPLTKNTFEYIELPLLRMVKNARDTLKPYKTIGHLARDLFMMPVYGTLNLFIAACFLFTLPVALLSLLGTPFADSKKEYATNRLKEVRFLLTAILVNLVSGITQIAAWPLSILRTPIRGLITLIKGAPTIEAGAGFKALLEMHDKPEKESKQMISTALILKFTKAYKEGQKTRLTKPAAEALVSHAEIATNHPVDLPENIITQTFRP